MALQTKTSESPTDFRIVHSVPGRMRIRLDRLRWDPDLAPGLEELLSRQKGVHCARINEQIHCLVVEYEPELFDPVHWFETINLDEVPKKERVAYCSTTGFHAFLGKVRQSTYNFEHRVPPRTQFALSVASLAASVLGAPPVLVRTAVLAAIVPMVNRALQLAIEERRLGSDILDAASCVVLICHQRFGPAALMTCLVSLGELMRYEITKSCQKLFTHQLQLGQESAWLIKDLKRMRVPVWDLKPGDKVVVYPGELISICGHVYAGEGMIAPASPQFDFAPVAVGVGDTVQAHSVLTDGKLYMINEQAAMCPLMDPMRMKETRRWLQGNRLHKRSLKTAYSLVLPMIGLASVMFAFTRDVQRAMAIVCFDFITGIRVAIPVAVLSSMYNAGQKGIVIRSASALENLAEIDAVIFARAGALTALKPRVTDIFVCEGFTLENVTALAAGVVQRYNHLGACAIYSYAKVNRIPVPERKCSEWIDGKGVVAEVEGNSVFVGSSQLARERNIDLSPAAEFMESSKQRGDTRACVAIDGKLAGVIAYHDPLRPEAAQAVVELKRLGIREIAVMSSGGQAATEKIAQEAHIDNVHSRTTPEDQADIVKRYKQRGWRVAVVGYDAANTLALEQADVAISLGVSADSARHRSDVVLTSDDLGGLVEGIELARSGVGLARQNIMLTAVPNLFGLSLSLLNRAELLAATLMNNGSVIVAAVNGLRPLLDNPPPDEGDETVAPARGCD